MSISNWVNVAAAIAIAFLLALVAFQHERIKYFDSEYEALSEKISQLEVDAQNESERYKQAQQEADEKVEKSKKETGEIILAQVPAECDKAMQWAVEEAKAFAA